MKNFRKKCVVTVVNLALFSLMAGFSNPTEAGMSSLLKAINRINSKSTSDSKKTSVEETETKKSKDTKEDKEDKYDEENDKEDKEDKYDEEENDKEDKEDKEDTPTQKKFNRSTDSKGSRVVINNNNTTGNNQPAGVKGQSGFQTSSGAVKGDKDVIFNDDNVFRTAGELETFERKRVDLSDLHRVVRRFYGGAKPGDKTTLLEWLNLDGLRKHESLGELVTELEKVLNYKYEGTEEEALRATAGTAKRLVVNALNDLVTGAFKKQGFSNVSVVLKNAWAKADYVESFFDDLRASAKLAAEAKISQNSLLRLLTPDNVKMLISVSQDSKLSSEEKRMRYVDLLTRFSVEKGKAEDAIRTDELLRSFEAELKSYDNQLSLQANNGNTQFIFQNGVNAQQSPEELKQAEVVKKKASCLAKVFKYARNNPFDVEGLQAIFVKDPTIISNAYSSLLSDMASWATSTVTTDDGLNFRRKELKEIIGNIFSDDNSREGLYRLDNFDMDSFFANMRKKYAGNLFKNVEQFLKEAQSKDGVFSKINQVFAIDVRGLSDLYLRVMKLWNPLKSKFDNAAAELSDANKLAPQIIGRMIISTGIVNELFKLVDVETSGKENDLIKDMGLDNVKDAGKALSKLMSTVGSVLSPLSTFISQRDLDRQALSAIQKYKLQLMKILYLLERFYPVLNVLLTNVHDLTKQEIESSKYSSSVKYFLSCLLSAKNKLMGNHTVIWFLAKMFSSDVNMLRIAGDAGKAKEVKGGLSKTASVYLGTYTTSETLWNKLITTGLGLTGDDKANEWPAGLDSYAKKNVYTFWGYFFLTSRFRENLGLVLSEVFNDPGLSSSFAPDSKVMFGEGVPANRAPELGSKGSTARDTAEAEIMKAGSAADIDVIEKALLDNSRNESDSFFTMNTHDLEGKNAEKIGIRTLATLANWSNATDMDYISDIYKESVELIKNPDASSSYVVQKLGKDVNETDSMAQKTGGSASIPFKSVGDLLYNSFSKVKLPGSAEFSAVEPTTSQNNNVGSIDLLKLASGDLETKKRFNSLSWEQRQNVMNQISQLQQQFPSQGLMNSNQGYSNGFSNQGYNNGFVNKGFGNQFPMMNLGQRAYWMS